MMSFFKIKSLELILIEMDLAICFANIKGFDLFCDFTIAFQYSEV
jgi:hypothetical protein